MLVAAVNATELPKLGSPKMKLRVHASHTGRKLDGQDTRKSGCDYWKSPVRVGDLRFKLTTRKNRCPGSPPSRANAYIMRELDVIEKVLANDYLFIVNALLVCDVVLTHT